SDFYKNLYEQQIRDGLDINVFIPVSHSFSTNKKFGNYSMVSPNYHGIDRIFYNLKHKKIHKDILKNYRIKDYSIIHAHSLFSNGLIAMKLKKEFNIPYVVAVRNTDVNTFFKYMIHLRKLGIEIL